ncbi:ABC transporter permease [Caldibacillus lycopersici]|uniref:ABC transporter permease n=1 Tax=Perspicuibacillus lycopersici TaxID=1325689 RepID=A0AAE3IRZ2_9BACI|nr:ABC transporter permease [Perspicuibacillus lycopersici]MCU9613127.1 ABC transporter permease [Perspicuibacillus lycopersici]
MKNKNIDIREYGILIFFIVLFIFLSIFANGFLSVDNLINVTRQVSVMGIVAVGMTLIIITGGIDLSVGSILAASGCLSAYMMVNAGIDPVTASLMGILLGSVIGLINGFMITKISIPPFVATLATMTAARGIAYIITDARPIYGFPESFNFIGQGYIWIIPVPVIVMILVFLIGSFILNKLAFGRHVYAIGGNEEAATLSGIKSNKVKMLVYILGGTLAGLAGVILLSRINTGLPSTGNAFELDVITAVILGGVSITGGSGKLRGVVLGVLIMGILSNGLIIMGVQEYWQWVVRGLVLAIAVGFDKNAQLLSNFLTKKKPKSAVELN